MPSEKVLVGFLADLHNPIICAVVKVYKNEKIPPNLKAGVACQVDSVTRIFSLLCIGALSKIGKPSHRYITFKNIYGDKTVLSGAERNASAERESWLHTWVLHWA